MDKRTNTQKEIDEKLKLIRRNIRKMGEDLTKRARANIMKHKRAGK